MTVAVREMGDQKRACRFGRSIAHGGTDDGAAEKIDADQSVSDGQWTCICGPARGEERRFCGGGCEEILECRFAPCERRDDGQPHSPAPLDAFGGDGEIARRCHVVLPPRFCGGKGSAENGCCEYADHVGDFTRGAEVGNGGTRPTVMVGPTLGSRP